MHSWQIGLRLVGGIVTTAAVVAGACNVYTEDLLESGEGGSGNVGNNTPTGGTGGSVACTDPSQCPGTDGECGTRTCVAGSCGMNATAADTPIAQQTPADCLQAVCDGFGGIVGRPDDTDLPNDYYECTVDSCSGGVPDFTPLPLGTDCASNGGHFCNVAGICVECLYGTDCSSGICTQGFVCAPTSCGDGYQNGAETDIDCGGGECPQCEIGDDCLAPSDCLSGECSGTCQPSCTDGEKNENETDVDCGGSDCPKCDFGEDCLVPGDCTSGGCSAGHTCSCPPRDGVVIISEVRTRGPDPTGGSNEFVELYNAGSTPVTLTDQWVLTSRSETASTYSNRFVGSGQVVPVGGHFLIAGSSYVGPAPDAALTTGISDEISLVLSNGATVVDAVCFYCGTPAFTDHICEGAPFTRVGCTSNIDRSIERKPGGAQGNCIDTGVSADDWAQIEPSNPQNLASPPT